MNLGCGTHKESQEDIVLGQLNESHEVWLLEMTQYENCRELKFYTRSPYCNWIPKFVIIDMTQHKIVQSQISVLLLPVVTV